MNEKILLVEDDENLITTLGDRLRGERYMVDMKTYKQLHPEPAKSKYINSHSRAADRKDMSSAVMEAAEPPEGPGRLVFSSTITAYNLRRKVWRRQYRFISY